MDKKSEEQTPEVTASTKLKDNSFVKNAQKAFLVVKEVIFVALLAYFVFSISFSNKKELLNYGYMAGWNFSLKAFSAELRNVDKEVLDVRFIRWRKLFRKQVTDQYKVDILEGWEKASYSENVEAATNISKSSKGTTKVIVAAKLADSVDFRFPLNERKKYNYTSRFGQRLNPFHSGGEKTAFHGGIDIAGARGTKVFAVGNGVIQTAGRSGGYGNLVVINHGKELQTYYGHLHRILVKKGQRIKKGDLIGIMGNTGRSTGRHLHFEVREKKVKKNPALFI